LPLVKFRTRVVTSIDGSAVEELRKSTSGDHPAHEDELLAVAHIERAGLHKGVYW